MTRTPDCKNITRPRKLATMATVFMAGFAFYACTNTEVLPSNEASGSSDSSSSSSGGASESTAVLEEPACVSHDDCSDTAAPFCDRERGECTTCDTLPEPDNACAEATPNTPLCAETGCVACRPDDTSRCDDDLLGCDASTNECVPCTAHSQCSSGACDSDLGLCFADYAVFHVDKDGGQNFTSLQLALNTMMPGQRRAIVVHESSPYVDTVITGNRRVALIAAEGQHPELQGVNGNPALRVIGPDAAVYVEGLSLRGSKGGTGLVVEEGLADVRRTRIVDNDGGAIIARSGAALRVENSFLGAREPNMRTVTIYNSTANIVYSSIGGGPGSGQGDSAAVLCDGAATVEIRNSLVMSESNSPEVVCERASIDFTVTETDIGGSNTSVGELDLAWFVDYSAGDLSLTEQGSEVMFGAARWEPGDPVTDIDGDPRPSTPSVFDYAGADVP